MSESELETLMKNISNFTKKIYSVPEFREWKKQITLKTLMYMDGFEGENNNLKDFKFSEKIENEYKLVDLFIKLHSCYISFCDCEYYFRRYPFRGLPIERDTHLKYICEMYFNRIYEFKEKMKNLFDEIHKILAKKTNAGSIIKSYSHKFSIELTHRNLTNHHHGFDCLELSSLTLASIAARLPSNQGKGWDDEYNAIYRKESRTWASRVRNRSVDMLSYLEIIAKFMNENCKFLE